MNDYLVGENVYLRAIETEDLQIVAFWRNSPELWRWFFNSFPISIGEQREWLENLRKNKEKKLFIICQKDGCEIGTIGIDNIDYKNQKVEFGNLLIGSKNYIHKGCAKDATTILLDFCFNHLNMNRVYLRVFSDNKTAIRFYENIGFFVEGIHIDDIFSEGHFRDTQTMSILRKDYLNG